MDTTAAATEYSRQRHAACSGDAKGKEKAGFGSTPCFLKVVDRA
jgi:hypothetical protein